MERRITFFVESAEQVADGWVVHGEIGLGPLGVGEQFQFVVHRDPMEEELVPLRIVEAAPDRLRLLADRPVAIRTGDILGGEEDR